MQAQQAPVLLGPTLELLPAIGDYLPRISTAASDAVSSSISRHLGDISAVEGGLHFITSLPAVAESSAPGAAAPKPAPEPAEPITASRCQIDIEGKLLTIRHVTGPPPLVNGAVVTGSRDLKAGDVIKLEDGIGWRLVEVQADN